MTEARAAGPWLIVGLGNPGPKYAKNRHNIGFLAVDRWLDDELPLPPVWKERWQAQSFSFSAAGSRCIVAKPQTFMNKSGDSVAELSQFHNTPPERIIVLHDELDFEFGRLAIKRGGGHGGHNGLRDIINRIGSRDFIRVRLGIGRPTRGEVSRWVLSDFSQEQDSGVDDLLRTASRAVSRLTAEGLATAMQEFNSAPSGASETRS